MRLKSYIWHRLRIVGRILILKGGGNGTYGTFQLEPIQSHIPSTPDALDTEIYDEVVCVTEEEAYAAARLIASREGVLVGISSGAALRAAKTLANREENKDKTIVVLLPDSGERYLSTELFN